MAVSCPSRPRPRRTSSPSSSSWSTNRSTATRTPTRRSCASVCTRQPTEVRHPTSRASLSCRRSIRRGHPTTPSPRVPISTPTLSPPARVHHPPTHAGQRAPAGDVPLPRRPGQPPVPHPRVAPPQSAATSSRSAASAAASRAEAALCQSPLPAGGRPPATDSSAAGAPPRARAIGRSQRARAVPPGGVCKAGAR